MSQSSFGNHELKFHCYGRNVPALFVAGGGGFGRGDGALGPRRADLGPPLSNLGGYGTEAPIAAAASSGSRGGRSSVAN